MLVALGGVRPVAVELRARLIRPPTVTVTECVVVHVVVPEHDCCAFRWLAPKAASMIAAHAVGIGFIVVSESSRDAEKRADCP
jgi:hypothetical protein